MENYNTKEQVIAELKLMGSPNQKDIDGMKRFGIYAENPLCIRTPEMRKFAKALGKNHKLAIELMNSDIHEAKHIGIMIANPQEFTLDEANAFVEKIGSWDICDNFCFTIMDKTNFAFDIIPIWCADEREYVRRAGFALIASIAIHDKSSKNDVFEPLLDLIIKYSYDERNFVKKAVNWALRQIGKRNEIIIIRALEVAEIILKTDTKAGRWIARDAIRELSNPKHIGKKGL